MSDISPPKWRAVSCRSSPASTLAYLWNQFGCSEWKQCSENSDWTGTMELWAQQHASWDQCWRCCRIPIWTCSLRGRLFSIGAGKLCLSSSGAVEEQVHAGQYQSNDEIHLVSRWRSLQLHSSMLMFGFHQTPEPSWCLSLLSVIHLRAKHSQTHN